MVLNMNLVYVRIDVLKISLTVENTGFLVTFVA